MAPPRVTEEGKAFIRRAEGWAKRLQSGKAAPYLCPAGKWTIGFGSCTALDGKPVHPSTPSITREEGETLFRRDIAKAEQDVLRLVRVPLTDSQLSALVSFVYNFGQTKFAKSTLLRKLNAGDLRGAADELPRWVNVVQDGVARQEPGLVARRAAERAMLLHNHLVPA